MTASPPSTADGTTVADFGERALVVRVTDRLTSPSWVTVGAGDDAAVLEPVPRTLEVLSTDALVEGVHFDRRFCSPDAIGHKALAVNLSDLAAMGATPRAALLSLMLPDDLPVVDLDQLLDGLLRVAEDHNVALVGGNITRAGADGRRALIVSVTALGTVGRRDVLTRSGARPGDDVYVTGSIGAGAVGLGSLRSAMETPGTPPETGAPGTALGACRARYLRPVPRVRVGMLLGRNRAATACMDLSDGLADAARQLASASQVGLTLDAAALPIDEAVMAWYRDRGQDELTAVLAGGDDYELLFTVRPERPGRLRAVRRYAGDLPITRIGTVTRKRELRLTTSDGDRDLPTGYEHFRS
jgi:thiamine-monophosphate kinase